MLVAANCLVAMVRFEAFSIIQSSILLLCFLLRLSQCKIFWVKENCFPFNFDVSKDLQCFLNGIPLNERYIYTDKLKPCFIKRLIISSGTCRGGAWAQWCKCESAQQRGVWYRVHVSKSPRVLIANNFCINWRIFIKLDMNFMPLKATQSRNR
jgi:hypothetical protein